MKDCRVLQLCPDEDIRKFVSSVLSPLGCTIAGTGSFSDLDRLIPAFRPEIIMVDDNVPGADIYRLGMDIRAIQGAAYTPLIVTAASADEICSRHKTFFCGIADILEKPLDTAPVVDSIRRCSRIAKTWQMLEDNNLMNEKLRICISFMHRDSRRSAGDPEAIWSQVTPLKFRSFRDHLVRGGGGDPGKLSELMEATPFELYHAAARAGLPQIELAREIAEFLGSKYIRFIPPEQVMTGILPPLFCSSNNVLPMQFSTGRYSLLMSNPFEWELIEYLRSLGVLGTDTQVFITKPDNFTHFFAETGGESRSICEDASSSQENSGLICEPSSQLDSRAAAEVVDHILYAAVSRRASDIHIEPKTTGYLVRFRIDGDLHDYTFLKEMGSRLITKFKVSGGMDIGESRKPQDGVMGVLVQNTRYNLRLATSSTPHGEGMIIRLLNMHARVRDVVGLGMLESQSNLIRQLTARRSGLILTVGPAGSGKTTTVYSILSHVDCLSRSVLTVEDPIEYNIPFANQQQVNEKAGLTYETLLRASVRQDPNVLFIGEMRDQISARIAMDFTSTGHLTLSTMHTSNATTAVFRLERLGITRSVMSENILAIIAQRLLKCLCPSCRRVEPISGEERAMLEPFIQDIPEVVGRPIGCGRCSHSGYLGRTGIYEVVYFDSRIAAMVREGMPISDIRKMLWERGDYLIIRHAIDKVRDLSCSVSEVYSSLLVEEIDPSVIRQRRYALPALAGMQDAPKGLSRRVLLIDADPEVFAAIEAGLESSGCEVDLAADISGALALMDSREYLAVIADHMSGNPEALKLLELMHQKNIEIPVVFMTSSDEADHAVLEYAMAGVKSLRKPLNMPDLLMNLNLSLRTV